MAELPSDIPIVDVRDLSSPRAERQRAVAEALRTGLGAYGLVYVSGHGLDPERVEALYARFLAFTARPTEDKARYGRAEQWFQRGWTPPETERAVAAGGQPDFKECWFAAPEPADPEAKVEYPEIYADNVWPDEDPSFAELYLDVGHQLHEIGLSLLRGCARALGLEPYRLEAAVHGGPHVTRALRYLPLAPEQLGRGIVWGEEHTDFNLLTLLPGGRFLSPEGQFAPRPDDVAGLRLRTRATAAEPSGRLVRGLAPEGCLVAQVGQQLEILTGGVFQATPHVINAPTRAGWSRVSLAHFIHLHPDRVLTPLPPFRTAETLAAYRPPVLAGTYSVKTLVDIGLAPRDALSQLGFRHYDRLDEARARDASDR
jgi:isopenicillin N synthase-like dioxygenase